MLPLPYQSLFSDLETTHTAQDKKLLFFPEDRQLLAILKARAKWILTSVISFEVESQKQCHSFRLTEQSDSS